MRPDPEWLQQWEADQLDPNNWLKIPDFNVKPLDVGFAGFSYPIVHPGERRRDLADSVRYMVTVARSQAVESFDSLDALMDEWDSGLGAGPAFDFIADLTRWEARASTYYVLAMQSFTRALSTKDPRVAMNELATGSALMVDWATNRNDATERLKAAVEARRVQYRAAGIKSGEARRETSQLPAPSQLRAERDKLLGLGQGARDIASTLARRYSVTSDHIRKTLKKHD